MFLVPAESLTPPASTNIYLLALLPMLLGISRFDDAFGREDDSRSKPNTQQPAIDIQADFDFEFHLEDPVTMLPADQLFSDGKLLPLHFSTTNRTTSASDTLLPQLMSSPEETAKSCRRMEMEMGMEMEISGTDPYLFSPKAPRCSSRWKELLGLKKFSHSGNQNLKSETTQTTRINPKLLKHFLHRTSKSCSSSSASSDNLPLLKDSDSELISISSSRLSLSSSSSGHDHDDLPRLSLDSDKPGPNPFAPSRSLNPNPAAGPNTNPQRMRMVKPRASGSCSGEARAGRSPVRRAESGVAVSRGLSVDSPRLNSSGKIVFQNLGRSSSSPSSFNGGPRIKHRGMERSYSSNIRVTPVLNVPVSSLRGSSKSVFGQLFSSSPQKNGNGNGGGSKAPPQTGGGSCKHHRSDRNLPVTTKAN